MAGQVSSASALYRFCIKTIKHGSRSARILRVGTDTSRSATTLLPEQAKPGRSITRMVLPIRQFFLGLALRGSCQIGLSRVCKPQVGGSIPLASSWIKTCSFPQISFFEDSPPSYFDGPNQAAIIKVVKPCVLAGCLKLILGFCRVHASYT